MNKNKKNTHHQKLANLRPGTRSWLDRSAALQLKNVLNDTCACDRVVEIVTI